MLRPFATTQRDFAVVIWPSGYTTVDDIIPALPIIRNIPDSHSLGCLR